MIKRSNEQRSRSLASVLEGRANLSPGAETVLSRVFWRPNRPVAPRVAEVWRLPLPEGRRGPAT